MARIVGDLDAVTVLLERSLAASIDRGFRWGTAWLRGMVGSVALDQNGLLPSLPLIQDRLRDFWDREDMASAGSVLYEIALLAVRNGQPEHAARFLGVDAPTRAAVPAPARPQTGAGGPAFGLTPREMEILRTLASGRTTNRELADTHSIIPETADNHVDNILAKMGGSSRVAAVALANRDRLFPAGH